MLIALLNYKKQNKFIISEAADSIGIKITHPYFLKIINYLKAIKGIEEIEVYGRTKLLKLNYKKTRNLVNKQQLVQEIENYFLTHRQALII